MVKGKDRDVPEFVTKLKSEQDSPRARKNNEDNLMRFRIIRDHQKVWSNSQWRDEVEAKGVLQVPFRPLWAKTIQPLVDHELVQEGLDAGMSNLDSSWKRGDAPWELGMHSCDWRPRPKEGALEYYQAQNRCYNVVLFSLQLGRLLFPRLEWRVMLSERHTIAVGIFPGSVSPEEPIHSFQKREEILVCMDLLFSDRGFNAEQSMDFADPNLSSEAYFDKWS